MGGEENPRKHTLNTRVTGADGVRIDSDNVSRQSSTSTVDHKNRRMANHTMHRLDLDFVMGLG